MAPVDKIDHGAIEAQLHTIVQALYEMMIQIDKYDAVGLKSRDVLQDEIKILHDHLISLHSSANSSSMPEIRIPPELIQYVDSGRNPDIYTREFVELARRGNQLMRGKEQGFADFRDILAREMAGGLPELKEDIERVVVATGGKVPGDAEVKMEGT